MKNMVEFVPCFSAFRHNESGGVCNHENVGETE